MVGYVSWTCSGFCTIYAGNRGTSQAIGEVRSSCLCIKAKVYESLLCEVQVGFRPGRRCMDQIFSLCTITEILAVN